MPNFTGIILPIVIGFIIGYFSYLDLKDKKRIELCSSYSLMASKVMEGHQDGVPISTFLSINESFDYATRMTKEAYGYPVRKTKSEKEKEVSLFKSMIEQRCLKIKKHY